MGVALHRLSWEKPRSGPRYVPGAGDVIGLRRSERTAAVNASLSVPGRAALTAASHRCRRFPRSPSFAQLPRASTIWSWLVVKNSRSRGCGRPLLMTEPPGGMRAGPIGLGCTLAAGTVGFPFLSGRASRSTTTRNSRDRRAEGLRRSSISQSEFVVILPVADHVCDSAGAAMGHADVERLGRRSGCDEHLTALDGASLCPGDRRGPRQNDVLLDVLARIGRASRLVPRGLRSGCRLSDCRSPARRRG